MIRSYEVVEDGKAIRCCICTLTSYNPDDVKNLYCGHCHIFHDDLHLDIDSEAALDPEVLKSLGIVLPEKPNGT